MKEGKGAEYVDRSRVVLIFASKGYFDSGAQMHFCACSILLSCPFACSGLLIGLPCLQRNRHKSRACPLPAANCMRELLRAVFDKKPVFVVGDIEAIHGGLTRDEVREGLQNANNHLSRWGLEGEIAEWGFPTPSPAALYLQLFEKEPIEWIRIGLLQDVSMRLIAEEILHEQYRGTTYVQGELSNAPPTLLRPIKPFHVYCSKANPGAAELINEVRYRHHLHSTLRPTSNLTPT